MKREDAEKLAKDALQIAVQNLQECGSVIPAVIIYNASKSKDFQFDTSIIPMKYANDTAKYQALSAIQSIIHKSKAVVAIHVSEAWLAVATPGQPLILPVGQNPDKSEVIIAAFKSSELSFAVIRSFSRKADGSIVIGDESVMDMEINLFGSAFDGKNQKRKSFVNRSFNFSTKMAEN